MKKSPMVGIFLLRGALCYAVIARTGINHRAVFTKSAEAD